MLRARARDAGCLLGHRITTFPQLTDDLARDLGVAVRVLEPEMAAVVLMRALDRPGTPPPWRAPGGGLLRELLRVLGELKAAYLGPEEVTAVLAALPPGPGAVRLGQLARVYAAYEAELARLGAVDRHGREWQVCDRLAAGGARPACLGAVARVVFAEIYDFSVLQFLIATALVRLVGDAELIAFAHPENVDATRFLERTWNRFVGDPSIADQVLPAFVERGGREGNLAAALRGVFAAERPEPVPADGSIRVVAAPSRYREVEVALRDVRRRLEAGRPPERMAILARDLTVYREQVEDVARRYRVPVRFQKGRPLVASGLVKTCLNVLRAAVEGVPRGRLASILETDYLGVHGARLARTLARSGFVAETARPLAECLNHQRARLARDAEAAHLSPARRAVAARRRARLDAHAARLLAVVGTLRALDAPRGVAAHVRELRAALKALRVRVAGPDPLVVAAARRDGRAWERFQETLAVLGGLADALDLGAVPLADFVRLLTATLEPQEVDDGASRAGGVRALSVLDARGLDFDVVYLLGLDDGTFPAPHGESPVWSDAMKREASRAAATALRQKLGARAEGLPLGGLLRTAREASLEDPFLFFLALSMAEREIVLSWPVVDERGNPTVPSPFVDELRGCITALPETAPDPTALVPEVAAACEPAELVARAALDRWSRRPGAPPDRLGAALATALPDGAARLAAIDARARVAERRARYFLTAREDAAKAALADPFVGRLGRDLGSLPAVLQQMVWSPTALNEVGACGFKFFAGRVLKLEQEDDAYLAVDERERGTLMHGVLEDFFRAHPRLPADLAAARALGREFLVAARDDAPGAIAAKDPALFDVTWGQVGVALDEVIVLEHAAQAALGADVEIQRLLEEPLACALPDPAGGPPIQLAGRPDRVDVHRRGAVAVGLRVLDYKASRDVPRYRRLLDPEKDLGVVGFQVPVYLLGALARVERVTPDATLEGGYLLLRAADDDKEVVAPFTRALLGAAPGDAPLVVADRIRTLVAGVRAGRFDVDPAVCDPYCPYRTVCRYQPPPLEEEFGGGGA